MSSVDRVADKSVRRINDKRKKRKEKSRKKRRGQPNRFQLKQIQLANEATSRYRILLTSQIKFKN